MKYITALSILFLPFLLLAQPDDLPGGEVEVIKNFDARLLDTEKVKIKPDLPPLDTSTQRLTYAIPTKLMPLEYLPPRIRPVAIRTEKNSKGFKGYAKLGYGIPNSPYGEVGYRSFVQDQYDFGIAGKYHAANFKDINNQRFSDLNIGLNGTYYMDEGIAIGGRLNHNRNEVHFYGVPEDVETVFAREDVRQIFNTTDFNVKVFNGARTAGDINYEAGIDFYRITDNYASSENGFDLRIGGTKWFADKHPLTVQLRTDFTTFEDTVKQKLNNFFLNPTFAYHADAFKVKLGVNFASHNDEYFFLPDIEASANLVGSQLAVFVGWEGDLYKNNFRNITDYNPFIIPRFNLENNKYNRIYGGVKGSVRGISYAAEASYKISDQLALFLNDDNREAPFENIYGFEVLYDSVNIFNAKLTLNFNLIENLQVTGTLSQSFFDLEREEKAWHLPAFEANFSAAYLTFRDRITLKGELYVANGVPYLDDNRTAQNLNALFDISAGAEYRFTDNFGAFLSVNNLAANKRQRWNRYPTYGLNLLAGVTAKF
ncbi:MAG: hypothetical protein AAFO94_02365 [Bacteroidota bacterium]